MTLQWKLKSLQSQSNQEEHLEELNQRKQIGASDNTKQCQNVPIGSSGGIRLKLNVRLRDRPNSSTTVTTTVWLSVPNLSIPTTSGNEQLSAGPSSNEHWAEATGLLKSQSNPCLPGTAKVLHDSTSSSGGSIGRRVDTKHE